MVELATYSAIETLRNGRQVTIRALRTEDRDDFVAAASRLSAHSLQRRFFTMKRGFSEKEISLFVNVDFVNHVALVAVLNEDVDQRSWAVRDMSSCRRGMPRWPSPLSIPIKGKALARS